MTEKLLCGLLNGRRTTSKRVVKIAGLDDSLCQLPRVRLLTETVRLRSELSLPRPERIMALRQAADFFQNESLGDQSPAEYVSAVSLATGLNSESVAETRDLIANSLRDMSSILDVTKPRGASWEWTDVKHEGAMYTPAGSLLAVIAPGNGPGPHALWPQALGLGYKVIIRPSSREPFTPSRLVQAFCAAGLEQFVSLFPCSRDIVPDLISEADYTLMYGGDDLIGSYQHNKQVLTQGPGRTKILVGRDADWSEAVDVVCKSVTDYKGKACVCASAILVEGDHKGFADLLLERFGESDAVVETVDYASDPRVQQERPYARCVVAPFDPEKDLQQVSNSLVLTVLGGSNRLIDSLAKDGTIRNLYVGAIPTTRMNPTVPHDGYLGESLMFCRGVMIENGS